MQQGTAPTSLPEETRTAGAEPPPRALGPRYSLVCGYTAAIFALIAVRPDVSWNECQLALLLPAGVALEAHAKYDTWRRRRKDPCYTNPSQATKFLHVVGIMVLVGAYPALIAALTHWLRHCVTDLLPGTIAAAHDPIKAALFVANAGASGWIAAEVYRARVERRCAESLASAA